jgi:hypothetical protein
MWGNLNRRRFLSRSVGTSLSFYLLPSVIQASPSSSIDEKQSSSLRFFSESELSILNSLCDQILSGASSMGAVDYIENLLTAFDSNPPRIFAGGPYSGRKPYPPGGQLATFPVDSFLNFIPLTRAQEAAWKLKLYGSAAFPDGWWNQSTLGDRPGLRNLFKHNLAKIISAREYSPTLDEACQEFRKVLRELVVEGCFAAPEYGGNKDLKGWKIAQFQGDSQPLGYTAKEVSEEDLVDPHKLSFTTKTFLSLVSLFNKGKVF